MHLLPPPLPLSLSCHFGPSFHSNHLFMFASLGRDTNCQKNQSSRCNSSSASLLPLSFPHPLYSSSLSFLLCRFGQFKLSLVHRTQSFSRMRGMKPVSLSLSFEWIWFLPNFVLFGSFPGIECSVALDLVSFESLSLLWVPWDRASVSPTSPSSSLIHQSLFKHFSAHSSLCDLDN